MIGVDACVLRKGKMAANYFYPLGHGGNQFRYTPMAIRSIKFVYILAFSTLLLFVGLTFWFGMSCLTIWLFIRGQILVLFLQRKILIFIALEWLCLLLPLLSITRSRFCRRVIDANDVRHNLVALYISAISILIILLRCCPHKRSLYKHEIVFAGDDSQEKIVFSIQSSWLGIYVFRPLCSFIP